LAPARDGGLVKWDGGVAQPLSGDFGKLPVSDEIFANLVDTSEADAVLTRINDSHPDLLAMDSLAECHARVARHLRIANVNNIHAAPEREHFSVLALTLADDFTELPTMSGLLRRIQQGTDYGSEISALPDEFWQEAER
jgi:hypothetical protein